MSSSIKNYQLRPLSTTDLPEIEDYANKIYDNAGETYPDFALNLSKNLSSRAQRAEFFRAFVMPATYHDFNIRQAYMLTSNNEIISIVGVRRWTHWPSWSVSWLLSNGSGGFIEEFRELIKQLCHIHESANMCEFYVGYPAARERAYSRIMLPFRQRYHTFVECTVTAGQRSPYQFIHQLLGERLYTHDMNVRRYILKRTNQFNE